MDNRLWSSNEGTVVPYYFPFRQLYLQVETISYYKINQYNSTCRQYTMMLVRADKDKHNAVKTSTYSLVAGFLLYRTNNTKA